MQVSSRVPPKYHNWFLVDYLAARFTYQTVVAWQAWVTDGHVWCNAHPATAETMVCQGDEVVCDVPAYEQPEVDFSYTIVYEDEWLIGVNKPTNLRVHGNGRFTQANLIYHLRQHHCPEADLVNRLDAQTSGLVVVAKSKEALRQMQQLFQAQAVTKRYLAIVCGQLASTADVLDWPLAKQFPKQRFSPFVVVEKGEEPGKTAVTHYQLQCHLGDSHSLVELQPKSGRTHQLRVHMAALGYPILGDSLYNPEGPTSSRLALHCFENQFLHPFTQQTCSLQAPLSSGWYALVASLQN